jgi:xanthine dehydrogenase accessory factor
LSSWLSTLSRLLETATPAVLVTVAATRGSVPRAPGAHMVVSVAQAQGSVGGGRLEQRAIEIARERLVADAPTPHLERFVLGASLGQCCGGVVVLAFEHVGPAQRKWVERAAALAAAGRAWGRLVLIDGPRAGEVAVFDSASLESTCAPPLAAHAHRLLAAGADTALLVPAPCRSGARREPAADPATAPGSAAARDPDADSRLAALLHQDIAARGSPDEDIAAPCRSGARREPAAEPASTPGLAARCESAYETAILLDASPPPALQVVMFGAGHVGRALAELFGRLPLRVRWIDERAGEFPPTVATNIETRCTDTPTAEVREAPAGAVFLVLTHSHALDFELVEAILARDDLRFCGLIGSQTKRMRFVHRLRARGVEEARVARLRCPVGLPGLPGKEAEVIALAIAAEVMRLRPREDPAAASRWPEAESEAAQPTASGQER